MVTVRPVLTHACSKCKQGQGCSLTNCSPTLKRTCWLCWLLLHVLPWSLTAQRSHAASTTYCCAACMVMPAATDMLMPWQQSSRACWCVVGWEKANTGFCGELVICFVVLLC